MNEAEKAQAIAACKALCAAHSQYADAGEADAFAALYVSEAIFDRLGQKIVGREAIRRVIADRPAGVWTKHSFTNIRVELDEDGRSASGVADLDMQRGKTGNTQVDHIQAEFRDRFVLAKEGWRFATRRAVLKSEVGHAEQKP